MNHYDTHERFIQTYGEKYLNKIEHLRKRLVDWETGEDKFVVVPFEAGIGKSLQTDRIVGEYVGQHDVKGTEEVFLPDSNRFRTFLMVKPFIEDVLASVERINQHCGRPDVALGITKDNWSQYRDDADTLSLFRVVVITHERYLGIKSMEWTPQTENL
ncbi:hypothetical protein LLE49_28205 [Alicyclobacillus tolerans]|uniref:hypothetical protein n=1 Tax=Alicyclobacillus tolerans TaxID=90970 RepID=UPI001F4433BE|nr:hypothetical protein [Alicyclobacillus tolerans]MCF8568605.1 hypothetical protein [Alicyclobacillus tolerans]